MQKFTMDLVDETRTCTELEIVLNYDPEGEPYKKGEFMHLVRLREAVESDQKEVSVCMCGCTYLLYTESCDIYTESELQSWGPSLHISIY